MPSCDEPRLMLDIALTSRCPLDCRYCTVEKRSQPEVSASQWKAIIASFARLRPIDLISLEGGEPFVRPDLAEILEVSLEQARVVKVVTSGIIPFQTLSRSILHHPRFYLELSMDGPKEIHDFLRDESWEKAWTFLQNALDEGVRIRLRSVISRHNSSIFEPWLMDLDKILEPFGKEVEFTFDTMIAPEALGNGEGKIEKFGLRHYPTKNLLPSPGEMWRIFSRLRKQPFRTLSLAQNEPLRGCGAGRFGVISFDPLGIFSFCCETPWGLGSVSQSSAAECLRLLDAWMAARPCRDCRYFQEEVCNGCSTGEKCGMVGYWKTGDCQTLHHGMIQEPPPEIKDTFRMGHFQRGR